MATDNISIESGRFAVEQEGERSKKREVVEVQMGFVYPIKEKSFSSIENLSVFANPEEFDEYGNPEETTPNYVVNLKKFGEKFLDKPDNNYSESTRKALKQNYELEKVPIEYSGNEDIVTSLKKFKEKSKLTVIGIENASAGIPKKLFDVTIKGRKVGKDIPSTVKLVGTKVTEMVQDAEFSFSENIKVQIGPLGVELPYIENKLGSIKQMGFSLYQRYLDFIHKGKKVRPSSKLKEIKQSRKIEGVEYSLYDRIKFLRSNYGYYSGIVVNSDYENIKIYNYDDNNMIIFRKSTITVFEVLDDGDYYEKELDVNKTKDLYSITSVRVIENSNKDMVTISENVNYKVGDNVYLEYGITEELEGTIIQVGDNALQVGTKRGLFLVYDNDIVSKVSKPNKKTKSDTTLTVPQFLNNNIKNDPYKINKLIRKYVIDDLTKVLLKLYGIDIKKAKKESKSSKKDIYIPVDWKEFYNTHFEKWLMSNVNKKELINDEEKKELYRLAKEKAGGNLLEDIEILEKAIRDGKMYSTLRNIVLDEIKVLKTNQQTISKELNILSEKYKINAENLKYGFKIYKDKLQKDICENVSGLQKYAEKKFIEEREEMKNDLATDPDLKKAIEDLNFFESITDQQIKLKKLYEETKNEIKDFQHKTREISFEEMSKIASEPKYPFIATYKLVQIQIQKRKEAIEKFRRIKKNINGNNKLIRDYIKEYDVEVSENDNHETIWYKIFQKIKGKIATIKRNTAKRYEIKNPKNIFLSCQKEIDKNKEFKQIFVDEKLFDKLISDNKIINNRLRILNGHLSSGTIPKENMVEVKNELVKAKKRFENFNINKLIKGIVDKYNPFTIADYYLTDEKFINGLITKMKKKSKTPYEKELLKYLINVEKKDIDINTFNMKKFIDEENFYNKINFGMETFLNMYSYPISELTEFSENSREVGTREKTSTIEGGEGGVKPGLLNMMKESYLSTDMENIVFTVLKNRYERGERMLAGQEFFDLIYNIFHGNHTDIPEDWVERGAGITAQNLTVQNFYSRGEKIFLSEARKNTIKIIKEFTVSYVQRMNYTPVKEIYEKMLKDEMNKRLKKDLVTKRQIFEEKEMENVQKEYLFRTYTQLFARGFFVGEGDSPTNMARLYMRTLKNQGRNYKKIISDMQKDRFEKPLTEEQFDDQTFEKDVKNTIIKNVIAYENDIFEKSKIYSEYLSNIIMFMSASDINDVNIGVYAKMFQSKLLSGMYTIQGCVNASLAHYLPELVLNKNITNEVIDAVYYHISKLVTEAGKMMLYIINPSLRRVSEFDQEFITISDIISQNKIDINSVCENDSTDIQLKDLIICKDSGKFYCFDKKQILDMTEKTSEPINPYTGKKLNKDMVEKLMKRYKQ